MRVTEKVSMKFANPLYYPLAVLVGGITFVVGVRFAQIPNVVILQLLVLLLPLALVGLNRATQKFSI